MKLKKSTLISIQRFIPILGIVALLIVLFEISFVRIYEYQKSLALSTIHAMLQDYAKSSNPYLLSQGIESLENSGLIKCTKIFTNKNRIYLNLSFKSWCNRYSLLNEDKKSSTVIKSINGSNLNIEFSPNIPTAFILLRWLTRITSFFVLCFYFLSILRQSKRELALTEGEKKLLLTKIKFGKQIAHDIRSPLAALEMAIQHLLTENTQATKIIKTAIGRIHNMADGLLYGQDKHNKVSICIADLIQSAIYEKEQNASDNKIKIKFNYRPQFVNIYCNLDVFNFLRSISNILNNAIEAFDNEHKEDKIISLELIQMGSNLEIIINDNAKGIDERSLKILLDQGGTFKKTNGHGLGLEQTKDFLKDHDGKLYIQSKINIGTSLTISIPTCEKPECLISSINITDKYKVALIDNDPSVLELVKQKLKVDNIQFYQNINSIDNFEDKLCAASFVFVDYELQKGSLYRNGIELIQSLGLHEKSVLYTANGDDPEVIKSCLNYGIKLLPKAHLKYTEIQFAKNNSNSMMTSDGLSILIDDDYLLRLSIKALDNNFECFSTIDNFLNSSMIRSRNINNIYIDSDLGDKKGEFEARKIYEQGYKNIYLYTGHSKEDFDLNKLPWLKGIVLKSELLLSNRT